MFCVHNMEKSVAFSCAQAILLLVMRRAVLMSWQAGVRFDMWTANWWRNGGQITGQRKAWCLMTQKGERAACADLQVQVRFLWWPRTWPECVLYVCFIDYTMFVCSCGSGEKNRVTIGQSDFSKHLRGLTLSSHHQTWPCKHPLVTSGTSHKLATGN